MKQQRDSGWEKVIPCIGGESEMTAEKQNDYGKCGVWGQEHEETGTGMQELGMGV